MFCGILCQRPSCSSPILSRPAFTCRAFISSQQSPEGPSGTADQAWNGNGSGAPASAEVPLSLALRFEGSGFHAPDTP